MSKTALNIISGQLGAGKTTLLRQLIKQQPPNETWVLLVNEFGAVGIDGPILSSQNDDILVKQLPGGCICCTAQGELEAAILEIIQTHQPDRILIEPTGLGEPESLVDIFKQAKLQSICDVHSLFSVFDIAHTRIEELESLAILQSMLTMADIIVLNKVDLASLEQTDQLKSYVENLYPPKKAIVVTEQADISSKYLYHPHFHSSAYTVAQKVSPYTLIRHQHKQIISKTKTELPYSPVELPGLLERSYQTQLNTQAIGWIFNDDICFNWSKLLKLFEDLSEGLFTVHSTETANQISPPIIKRAKGIFRVGTTARMLFQFVHNTITRELIAYRKDSRLELLLDQNSNFDFESFETALLDCIQPSA
ncbi:GTP-binding protein [Hydrogenovibrio sp. 3SP14C1]|uniref:CobW family GTP-binding protein n=1 Tax=Hydrogenovibrio sp. 3SP14C1 TaxID=3038774 RepID=UPI002417E883|nr:GTP-binding protein [Hydrogenovibrio sp. 3SP14C1]MDG4811691.1 GTP-binding protein [Hydrogenovibrio sp. 3SP14C1]